LKQLGRLVVVISFSLLAYWSYKGGNDLGERATLVQAVVAIVLVWVTWTSIDRSDKQLQISQSQVDISQNQLDSMQKQTDILNEQIELLKAQNEREIVPVLIVELISHRSVTTKTIDLELINLSNYPIYITSLIVETETAYLSFHSLDLGNQSLGPVESTKANLLSERRVFDFDKTYSEPYDLDSDEGDDEEVDNFMAEKYLRIDYYYGRTGGVPYSQSYKIIGFRMPRTHSSDRYWAVSLRQTEFVYLNRFGSFKEIKRFDENGMEVEDF
jgi:hypothetical protein